ncbi:MAG: hypothetical protein ACP5VS_14315 [Desulfomonilaceae bacterium]
MPITEGHIELLAGAAGGYYGKLLHINDEPGMCNQRSMEHQIRYRMFSERTCPKLSQSQFAPAKKILRRT